MKAERNENTIDVYLTAGEVHAIQGGQTIEDRLGVTMPDAKIEVLPLSVVGLDDSLRDRYAADRLRKGLSSQLKGNLYANGDLQVIVPAIKLTDVRIKAARLPREAISTPLIGDGKELVQHVIPEEGVIVHFGGSLEIIDVNSYYPAVAEQ